MDCSAIIARLVEAATDTSKPPLLMGVVNVTPDSFHDGGRFLSPKSAIEHGIELAAQGADIIDIGGESTRPGALPVSVDAELKRVIPVVDALAATVPAAISVDTRHARVAEMALSAGATIVNDVSGFRHDPEMPFLLGHARPVCIAMHMRGVPEDMQTRTSYSSTVADVLTELWNGVKPALDAGLPVSHVWLDPGIGFSKDVRGNLVLLRNLPALVASGRPVLVGVSRKSFIGHVTGHTATDDRLMGTAGAVAWAVAYGARILRVHDVTEMSDVVRVVHAIMTSTEFPRLEEVQ